MAFKLSKPEKKIFVKVNIYILCTFLYYHAKEVYNSLWNIRHINRSFNSFYSQTAGIYNYCVLEWNWRALVMVGGPVN